MHVEDSNKYLKLAFKNSLRIKRTRIQQKLVLLEVKYRVSKLKERKEIRMNIHVLKSFILIIEHGIEFYTLLKELSF